jgi:hypothetical protein
MRLFTKYYRSLELKYRDNKIVFKQQFLKPMPLTQSKRNRSVRLYFMEKCENKLSVCWKIFWSSTTIIWYSVHICRNSQKRENRKWSSLWEDAERLRNTRYLSRFIVSYPSTVMSCVHPFSRWNRGNGNRPERKEFLFLQYDSEIPP